VTDGAIGYPVERSISISFLEDTALADDTRRRMGRPPVRPAPHPAAHISKWPVVLALLALGGVYLVLPADLTAGPRWLLLAIETPVVVFFLVAHRMNLPIRPQQVRVLVIAILGVATLLIALSIAQLLGDLLRDRIAARRLLGAAAGLWAANVLIFALWYWEIDRGGPHRRYEPDPPDPDFLFPQLAGPDIGPPGWMPDFVDYLFVAFTSATAFSPTDTLPLTRRVKALLMAQELLSLIMVALLAARAINVLP